MRGADTTPELQDMYNRFRRDMLDPNKRYTIKETQKMLEIWLNKPRGDKFAPNNYLYPSNKQVGGVTRNMRTNSELKNVYTKNIYYYKREDGKIISRTQYRNIETNKLVTKDEYLRERMELGEDEFDERIDY